MRIMALSALAGATFLSAGCSSLLSLNPIATQAETASVQRLTGTWEKDGDLYIVRDKGQGSYEIRVDSAKFEARPFTIGDAQFLDVSAVDDQALQVPAHGVVRYWLEGDRLRWAFVDSEWIRQRLLEANLDFVKTKNGMAITAHGEKVREFLTLYARDSRAYGEMNELARLRD